MTRLPFPRALLFKEWMKKRWIALVVFLLISPSVYIEALMPYTAPGGLENGAQNFSVQVNTFTWFCNAILGHFTAGWWASLVVVCLAGYSLWTERNHDAVWFTLRGPVSKRQVLRSKYIFDLMLIVTVFTVLAMSLAVIDMTAGIHYPMFGIFRWWTAELAIQCSMYALALILATLIGNMVAVVLLSFGIANLPMYLGIPLTLALGSNPVVFLHPSRYNIPLTWKLQWILEHLSPLNWFNVDFGRMPPSPWPYFVWFLVFTVLSCLVSEWIYEQIAIERLSNFFAFKWLRHPLTIALSGVIAFIIVKFTVRTTIAGQSNYMVDVKWILILTLLFWLGVILTRRQFAKRF